MQRAEASTALAMSRPNTQSTLESFDIVYGLDRLVVGIIEDADDTDLLRLTSLILTWQREADRRLAKERRQKGTLS
jgi:hypothetical protein